MRNLVAVVLSVICGVLIAYVVTSLTIEPSNSSGVLHTPNLDRALGLIIMGFFGGVYGLVVCLCILGNETKSHTISKLLLSAIVSGVIYSSIWTAFTVHLTVFDGYENPVLTDFAMKEIIKTAIREFISGSLIGLASVIAVRFSRNA